MATGLWNVVDVRPQWHSTYGRTLSIKIVAVLASGATAVLHARARSTPSLAVFGALSGVTAVAALFLGVLLG